MITNFYEFLNYSHHNSKLVYVSKIPIGACPNLCIKIDSKYKIGNATSSTVVNDLKNSAHHDMPGMSNSHVHEEVVHVVQGYKPEFKAPSQLKTVQPSTNFKAKQKSKKNKGKKRVLKRVYHESIDGQSGYSSVISDYVDMSSHEHKMSLSCIAEGLEEDKSDHGQIQQLPADNGNIAAPEMIDIEQQEGTSSTKKKKHRPPVASIEPSSPSIPADECNDSEGDGLRFDKNSPRQSFKVFNQNDNSFQESESSSSEPDENSNNPSENDSDQSDDSENVEQSDSLDSDSD